MVVILITPTVLMVDGIPTWIHHSHARPMAPMTEKPPDGICKFPNHPSDALKPKVHREPENEIYPVDMAPATSSVPREY